MTRLKATEDDHGGPNVNFVKSIVLLRRLGTVEEVAELVAYLAIV